MWLFQKATQENISRKPLYHHLTDLDQQLKKWLKRWQPGIYQYIIIQRGGKMKGTDNNQQTNLETFYSGETSRKL